MKSTTLLLVALGFVVVSYAQDLALQSPFGKINAPVSGCSLSGSENVTITIFNFGTTLSAGASFNVSYSINGGAPITELIIIGSSLRSNSSYTYTFTTPANFLTPGNYTIIASVSLTGDINTSNNSSGTINITNGSSPIGGIINGSTSACASGNNGALSLVSYSGTILRWEYSSDNGNTWYYISNTGTSQNYLNLKTTTRYRAVIQTSCGTVFSAIATITINC